MGISRSMNRLYTRSIAGLRLGRLLILLLVSLGAGQLSGCSRASASEAEKLPGTMDIQGEAVDLGRDGLQSFEPSMVKLPAGVFQMGSATGDRDERRLRDITIKPFLMAKYEVSQGEWREIMGDVTADFSGDDLPVDRVSWNEIQVFIKRLNQRSGKNYRLPSEAEWEYAARAGRLTDFSTGDCINTEQANYDGREPPAGCPSGDYRASTMAVDSLPANPWGLHHMHGNVWEWVQDCYAPEYPDTKDGQAFMGGSCSTHSLRGGSWYRFGRALRSSNRRRGSPDGQFPNIGFRLAMDLPKP